MIIKTIVNKIGNVKDYVHIPVLNKLNSDETDIKSIGVVMEANEVENGYELTIGLFDQLKYEFMNDEPIAISF